MLSGTRFPPAPHHLHAVRCRAIRQPSPGSAGAPEDPELEQLTIRDLEEELAEQSEATHDVHTRGASALTNIVTPTMLELHDPGHAVRTEAGAEEECDLLSVLRTDSATRAAFHRVFSPTLEGCYLQLDRGDDGEVDWPEFLAAMLTFQRRCGLQAYARMPPETFAAAAQALYMRLAGAEDTSQNITWASFTSALAPQTRPWRLWTFSLVFVGYLVYYLTRGSFTFVAPVMRSDMGWSLEQVGRATTLFPLMYGVSKFASGVAVDVWGSRVVFGVGLLASGALNLAITSASGPNAFAAVSLLWAANGFFQGFGAPACAKLLTKWFPTNERGKWWAIWTAAQNMGGAAIPIIAGSTAAIYGWRYGMALPGAIGVLVGLVLLAGVRDTPHAVNLPSADPPLRLAAKQGQAGAPASRIDQSGKPESREEADTSEESTWGVVMKYVFKNKAIWALAISYFFMYFVRQGMTSWAQFYMVEAKGVVSTAQAAAVMSNLEIGGFFGGLCAGALSDRCKGHRIRVVMAYSVGIAGALLVLMLAPAGHLTALAGAVAAVGFFIYGPQMLIGLIGAEVSHPRAVGTGNGLMGWIAYFGAAAAGEPLTRIVKGMGWDVYVLAMVLSATVPLVLLAPFWSVRSYADLAATPSDPAAGSGRRKE